MTTDTTARIALHSMVVLVALLSASIIYAGAMVGCLSECIIFASICSVVSLSVLYSLSHEAPL